MKSPVVDWLIQIDANEKWDSDLLVEHFNSDECTVVKESDDKYYLKSSHFKGIQDHKEVIATARPLMERMNGIAKIVAPWFHPVNSDKLTSIHDNGNRGVVILAGPLEFRIPTQIPPRTVLPGTTPPLGRAESFIRLADSHHRIAAALRIYGTRPPTWPNLFNIYEIIKEDMGGESQIATSGWIEKTELVRFKATANDPTAIGDEARHQKQSPSKKKPKHKAMSHEEAKAFLHDLLEGWLDSKTE